MSKLQKKKTTTEKKKRKVDLPAEGEAAKAPVAAAKQAAPVPSAKAKQAAGETVTSENVFTRAAEFIREVKVELKKVTWPSRKQTTGTTIVVILFVFVVAAFLGLFDLGLSKLVQIVLT